MQLIWTKTSCANLRLVPWMLLLLLLTGCRFTFLPLEPERAVPTPRNSLTGSLVAGNAEATATLELRRLVRPAYLELKWYSGETLLHERSLWAERPQTFVVPLPLSNAPYHRLVVLLENSPLLQLDLGNPALPNAPGGPVSPPSTAPSQP